jgi:hypothetical protein
MITRQDYVNQKATHREYYGQFVSAGVKSWVLQTFTKQELMQSTDPNLNDLPIDRWDRVIPSPVPFTLVSRMTMVGDYATLGGLVCIAKEAARQIIEENQE